MLVETQQDQHEDKALQQTYGLCGRFLKFCLYASIKDALGCHFKCVVIIQYKGWV